MQTGGKAQGQEQFTKILVKRHGHKRGRSRASYHRQEKAAETRVRRAGRIAARDGGFS
jgi:hypothetical protein